MIIGAHAIIYSRDPNADRAFLSNVLGFSSIDAGDGWLIFALPPSEVAVHPDENGGRHELYLLCDDIEATIERLGITKPIIEQRWGRLAEIDLPSGAQLGLYQPKHPLARSGRKRAARDSAIQVAEMRPKRRAAQRAHQSDS